MASLTVLKKSVECIICHEPQIIPKQLPCYHTFCKDCLDDMMKFDDDGSAIITCPLKCDGDVLIAGNQTTNSLPNNYSLQSVLDIIQTSDDNKEKICHETKDCANAICRSCSICSMKTCAICWEKHLCENRNCTIISYDQNSSCFHPWCVEHQTYAKYICFDCDERFVCIYCVNRNHKCHEKEMVEKYANATRNCYQSQMNISKDYLKQANVSYEEELANIKTFRLEMEKELQARMVNKLINYADRLKREKDVLLETFDVTVDTFKEDLANTKLLETNTLGEVAKYYKELAIKQDFEILSERSAIVKHIDALSVLCCFKVSLSTKCNEKDLLGTLNVECTKRNHASKESKSKIVELKTHL